MQALIFTLELFQCKNCRQKPGGESIATLSSRENFSEAFRCERAALLARNPGWQSREGGAFSTARPRIRSKQRRFEMQVIEAYGARIPQIGLGTMTLKDDVCVQAIKTALQMGYRHLDTAAFYANEKENGEGLRQSGVKREDVFICTKVRQGDLMPDAFAKVLEQSLINLKLPDVDLLLIHWNNPDIPLKLSVGALCKAKKEGKTKHIGVANFTTTMLDEAWAVTTEPLLCNQL